MVKKRKSTKDKRIKRNHKFQLNIARDVEAWLDEWIRILTKERKFSQYVRDGLAIMIQIAEWGINAASVLTLLGELREGRRDKMYELFPHLRTESIEQGNAPESNPAPPTPDTLKEIEELRKSNEQLRQMIKDLTDLVASMRREGSYIMSSDAPTQPMQPITGKQLGLGKMLAAPTFEDNDLLEFTAPKSTIDVSENLVRNMFGLQR